jgi:hypothetical protein
LWKTRNSGSVTKVAEEVKAGTWGGPADWLALEQRVLDEGLKPDDLVPKDDVVLFIPGFCLGRVATPVRNVTKKSGKHARNLALRALEEVERLHPPADAWVDNTVAWYVRARHFSVSRDMAERVRRAASRIQEPAWAWIHISSLLHVDSEHLGQLPFRAELKRLIELDGTIHPVPARHGRKLLDLLDKFPEDRYLLTLIAGWIPAGRGPIRQVEDRIKADQLQLYPTDHRVIREAVAILRLGLGLENATSDATEHVESIKLGRFRRLLGHAAVARADVDLLMEKLARARLAEPALDDSESYSLLAEVLEKREARLHIPEVYDSLRLPAPV